MELQFIDKVKNSNIAVFKDKLIRYSDMLGINPNWLMAVMEIESGCNPQAVNSISGATGLIQFMPTTAQNLGTTTAKIKQMKGEEQLDYVYKYFKPYAGKIKNLIDCYFVVFFPMAIGKSDNWVLQTSKLSANKIAQQNKGYDLNKDGKITRGEVAQQITSILKKKGFNEKYLGAKTDYVKYILLGLAVIFIFNHF